ncbi:MAG: asparaginase [Anaerolineae bacterium]|nr:asparaginase [Anaerolineae bacterium]
MQKRVYIAYTGGTIGMRRTTYGYAPASGFLAAQMQLMPELHNDLMPAYDIHEFDPLLDSSNMTPADWLKIAQDIAHHYDDYDGFIVLHGTDTMAYTAAALSFVLQGLRKPVILTGSQIPLCEVRNDARENLITVMLLAASYPIPEVCLYFGSTLLRGNRATKVDAMGFNAFASPNYPPLGAVGIDISINWDDIQPAPTMPDTLEVKTIAPAPIGALRLFPGMPAGIVRNMLQAPLKALVLEAYGVGNGPTRDRDFVDALREASDRGIIIIDCSQCLRGSVNLHGYATGLALAKAGVISGFDMTAEAALAKLFYLYSQTYSVDTIKRLLQSNLRGELTRPD